MVFFLSKLARSIATRWALRRCEQVGRSPQARGRIWVRGPGTVRLGDRVVLDGVGRPIELKTLERDSEIVISDDVHIGGGTSIEAVMSVRVGARSRLGAFAKVLDNNFHPLVGDRHSRPPSAPVTIGEDVQIGAHVTVLAGSSVGDGARIRPGTVLTRRLPVPAGRTVGGLPAVLE